MVITTDKTDDNIKIKKDNGNKTTITSVNIDIVIII